MRSAAILADLIFAGILLASNQCVGEAFESGPKLLPAEPPAGTERLLVKWVMAANEQEQPILMAVARPEGTGPFPVVILLHGTHGFAHEYVRLAQELAKGGLIAVAACWFSGGSGSGLQFVTPIGCPQLPLVEANSPEAVARVSTIIEAARALPGARPDRIALFGQSRGGGAATAYAMQSKDVRGLILNSTGYPAEVTGRAAEIQSPILMLHGEADSPAAGGSAMTAVQMARNFEAARRRAGKPVEAKYYKMGGHNSLFTDPAQHRDEVHRILEFLRQQLK